MPSPQNLELAMRKLASSGLEHYTLEQLRLDVYDAAETAGVGTGFYPLPALVINYMDPRTTNGSARPMRHHPAYPPFKRFRYLQTPPPDKNGKTQRYMQPAGSGVCAYFPTIYDWPAFFADPQKPCIYTEGEFKAMKGCDIGIATIGLGGVSNIGCAKTCVDFLEELEFAHAGRTEYICFDNDGTPNPDVLAAINRLAEKLSERGAIVYVTWLPSPNAQKVGLDDYLVAHTVEEFFDLVRDAQPWGYTKKLWELNNRWVKVCAPNMVLDRCTREDHATKLWVDHYSNDKVPECIVQRDGTMSRKPVASSTAWLAWPMRLSAKRLSYAPGQQEFTQDERGEVVYNKWAGWPMDPRKGDVTPWKRLLDYGFGTDKEARKWFEQWIGYQFQHPGTKAYQSVVLYSPVHGMGKSLTGITLLRVFGERNSKKIGHDQLIAKFNGWMVETQFVLADDIGATGDDRAKVSEALKAFIVAERLQVNKKFIDEYQLDCCANLLITTNSSRCVTIENTDRRYFIWEWLEKAPQEFFNLYDVWYRSDEAVAALLHHYMTLDLTGYDPHAPAPMTEAKEEMAESTRSTAQVWIHKLRRHPDLMLRQGMVPLEGDVWTAERLFDVFKTTTEGREASISPTTFAAQLKTEGVPRRRSLVRLTSGQRVWCFFVRNAEEWEKKTEGKIRQHMEQFKTTREKN